MRYAYINILTLPLHKRLIINDVNSRTAKRVAIVHNAYGKIGSEEIAIDNLVVMLAK